MLTLISTGKLENISGIKLLWLGLKAVEIKQLNALETLQEFHSKVGSL